MLRGQGAQLSETSVPVSGAVWSAAGDETPGLTEPPQRVARGGRAVSQA